ncbi:MAG TPA: hypothetical protein VKU84_02815 [Stellaceae bacterium]|nr:hypothetical protein [Stellaceae bacterium]
MSRMTEREILLEQARILRSLAATFEVPAMQEDVRKLAERCDALAMRCDAPEQPRRAAGR